MYNVFIFSIEMQPDESEMPVDSMQMSGCTKVQPYKLSDSNRVSRTATRYDGFVK